MGTRKYPGTKDHMTVGMLEDELRKLRGGMTEVINVLAKMDRRELVTTISDNRIVIGGTQPFACPAVGWECDEKVWKLKPATDRRMTASVRKSLMLFFDGVTPCFSRLGNYIYKFNKR